MAAKIRMMMELIKDIAAANSADIPILVKKKTVIFSRRPRPPIEMGSNVIAPIIGRNIRK